MKRFFYFLIAFSFASPSLQAQFCHPQDSLQLVKFYNSVNGQNSTLTWDLSQPVSTWEWVKLTPQGRVKSLWLIGKNLSGTLPADLHLPDLTLLGLGNNKIGGTLPKFDLLPNLRELELPNNQLTGSIPNYDSPFLQDLELNDNQLTGSIPKFKLPNLIALYLSNNQLTGEIPEFDTPLLGGLQLGHNQLTGKIPDFKNMPKLQWLNCQNNQLSGNIPAFSNLIGLWWLILDNNQLSGNIPNFQLPTLKTISLNKNQLNGSLPNLNLPNLRLFFARDNQLTGEIPTMHLPALFNLGLSNNQLTGKIPDMNYPKLRILDLSNNQLSGQIPDVNLPSLEDLYLSHNQLSGQIPKNVFDSLGFLELKYNHFTFENFEEVANSDIHIFRFAPQAAIPLHVSGKVLSVRAGGTLASNTYKWFKDSVFVAENVGDSTFVANQAGSYFCQVFNSILSNPASGDSLVLVSKMYKHTVSADEVFEHTAFRVSPNPIVEGQSLQILLENDFFGTVKFEILGLDGRVLHTFWEEKTDLRLNIARVLNPSDVGGSTFFVRVSDGKRSATRLVFKF